MKKSPARVVVCRVSAVLVLAAVPCVAQERSETQPRRASSERGEVMHPVIRLFDQDGDGNLDAAEIENAEMALSMLDSNGDGQISVDELPAQPGRAERWSRRAASSRRGRDSQGPFENPLLAADEEERKIFAALDEMRDGERYANVPENDGRLLRLLTEAVGAKRVVEIGTSTGESGVWFALALRTTGGHLYTHEIDPERAAVARHNFEMAGVAKLVTLIEGDAHQTVLQHKKPIDILFLDADKEGYIDYLNKLLPLVRPGGLIIAHNMNRRQADPAYVDAITKNPALETSFLLMEGTGVGVTMKKR